MNDEGKWYVIYTKTGDEMKVKRFIDLLFNNFNKKVVKTLIPKRIIMERKGKQRIKKIKYLFPGYVFIKTGMCYDIYYKITKLPYLIKFLKDESEPAEVKEDEIRIILALTNDSDLIGFSTGIKIGGRIKIIDGPLKGYEGLIEKIDKRKGRVKVRLNVSGNANLVDLGLHIIEDISSENVDSLSDVS
ncbi:antiterminator LoaP [Thermoanaerobacterium sp. RBIITD]|uniref:antiterminator LoaP n=1 Tax=Thermoanaerobacterium sp. RBIITD TaxID=1550240 RepID=UPI000BB6F772|nr:antiterminator LoaP [Thermoanaerobacterium sp. RBIITD]SNX55042.1 transcriptional antiterminator NusG [Thermoanaerobacterium sp. RBIITD]